MTDSCLRMTLSALLVRAMMKTLGILEILINDTKTTWLAQIGPD